MIIYFTGSGNSRDVATRLSTLLGDSDIVHLSGSVLRAPRVDAGNGCRRVVWVFPVYSWGIPPVVEKFMSEAVITGASGAEHHMVATCGDDAGLTGKQWRKLMRRRGWNAVSASTVIMPNTYTLMKGFDVDPEEIARKKLEASIGRVNDIAGMIRSGAGADDIVKGRFAWIKSRIIYPWFRRFAMNPKPFHATGGCISCGLCARECPMGNITMEGADRKHPCWGNDCALCLRCYHICPKGAVQYGKATAGKGRYLRQQHSDIQ